MKKYLFLALAALVGFVACETEPDTTPKQTLTLSVDNSEIYANGTQAATFTVKDESGAVVEDATIYFASSNEALTSKSFTTTYAGTYTFYAMKGNEKSNTVTVTAKEVTTETKVVTLTADTTSLKVNATVTFTVDCNGEDVTSQGEIYNAAGDTKLEGNTFTTAEAGEYSFYAMYEGEKSNNVTVTFTKDEVVVPDALMLSVTPATIYADGVEKATFTLTRGQESITDFELYNADGDVKLEGKEFTTTEPKVYTFYAMYEGEKSNNVELTARMKIVEEEQPIEIEATSLTIKANGVDSTQFTVLQSGANVTNSATIYINDGVLNGNKFMTTTPGTYTVYAMKGTVKSNELTITAEEVTATGKTIVFADGVTLTSGWYDVNKKGEGDNGDINMCWAATSSNMIQWFQDRYKAAGKTLPAGATDGPGVTSYTNYGPYELELMNVFHSQWDNSRGGHMQEAIPWYFEGVLNGGEYASPGSQAVPKTQGGFWKSIWATEVYPNIYHGYENIVVPGLIEYRDIYITLYNNYYLWGDGTTLLGKERLKVFSDLVVEAFEHGMAGLTVNLSANLTSVSHAVTLWGYEIDNATELVTRLWITDSDDLASEPKTQLLNEYSVSIDEGKSHVKLTGDTRYGACYVVSIHPFSGYGSAE